MTIHVLYIAAAVVVGIVGTARIVRVIVADSFPPAVAFRIAWDRVTTRTTEDGSEDGPWTPLAHCHWCMAPYITAANLAAALLSDLHPAWWIFNGWLAASYAVSYIVHHDED